MLKVTGLDLVHVLRNLRAARRADVIWTHTETEHLALGLLKRLRLPLPPVIAQSVWLVDAWPSTPNAEQRSTAGALRHVEQATTLSPVNAGILSAHLGRPVRFVPYGVVTEPWIEAPAVERREGPLRVLALGNDRHRDWDTLREVAGAAGDDLEVRVLTRLVGARLRRRCPGLTVGQARSVTETGEDFAWADVVCLPLRTNLHASGITVAARGSRLVQALRGHRHRRPGRLLHRGRGRATCRSAVPAEQWLEALHACATQPGRGSWQRRCGPGSPRAATPARASRPSTSR